MLMAQQGHASSVIPKRNLIVVGNSMVSTWKRRKKDSFIVVDTHEEVARYDLGENRDEILKF